MSVGTTLSSPRRTAAAWAHHREELLRGHAPGRRPIAWWVNEGPCRYPGYDEERRFLYQAGLLESAEREELIRSWRQDFEHGHRWSDVPPSLWAEWDEETAEHPPAA
jgi:hypothetical protein